jgi:hypothetical protein
MDKKISIDFREEEVKKYVNDLRKIIDCLSTIRHQSQDLMGLRSYVQQHSDDMKQFNKYLQQLSDVFDEHMRTNSPGYQFRENYERRNPDINSYAQINTEKINNINNTQTNFESTNNIEADTANDMSYDNIKQQLMSDDGFRKWLDSMIADYVNVLFEKWKVDFENVNNGNQSQSTEPLIGELEKKSTTTTDLIADSRIELVNEAPVEDKLPEEIIDTSDGASLDFSFEKLPLPMQEFVNEYNSSSSFRKSKLKLAPGIEEERANSHKRYISDTESKKVFLVETDAEAPYYYVPIADADTYYVVPVKNIFFSDDKISHNAYEDFFFLNITDGADMRKYTLEEPAIFEKLGDGTYRMVSRGRIKF